MNESEITISRQIERAVELAADTRQHRDELRRIHRELHELQAVRDEELTTIERANESSVRVELHQQQTRYDGEMSTLALDFDTQSTSLREAEQVSLQQVTTQLNEKLVELDEQRRNESWMLQAVLDEENDNSPTMEFDREAETYVTQKAILDERFEVVQQRVQQAQQYLQACHTNTEIDGLNIEPAGGRRGQLRDAAAEAGDLVIAQADELHDLHLPHWVRGVRLWGLSLLSFVLLWVLTITIKADLRSFLNPELRTPDWQWVGVAAVIALAITLVGSLILLFRVQSALRSRYQSILVHAETGRQARDLWEKKSEKNIDQLEQAATHWREQVQRRRRDQLQKMENDIDANILQHQMDAERQRQRITTDTENRVQQLSATRQQTEELLQTRLANDRQQAELRHTQQLQAARQECQSRFEMATESLKLAAEGLQSTWMQCNEQLRLIAQTATRFAGSTRHWPQAGDGEWTIPADMPKCLSVGDILVTASKAPNSPHESTDTSQCVEMPAVLRFPTDTSLLIEHDSAGREAALSFIRRQLLKLFTVIPAGRVRLTLIDPVGLGQSFSAMMHLTDFDELLIHSRIWTDSSQIRDQLQKVTEHMENIFQTYLRSQFETIEEYNASAGEVAEPYHFVVVAGFPTAFTEESARHLSSILTSGPRCGVHAIIAWNPAVGAPPSFDTDDLLNHSVHFRAINGTVQPAAELSQDVVFEVFEEPPAEEYVSLIRDVGSQSKDARRVEVSFNRIAPTVDDIWSSSTADGIDLPIGRAGAARLQFMRLGRGTSQHALVAGKTGSGKSTFLHILITNLALHYSPDEIQFYLIDFKKGVEFRTYAANRLPHARVVAIESDREFGLSVLERLDEILQERGELFRERGVQDVPAFREQFPTEPMPRLLLLIDEFQEFFVAEDRVSARASLLLDRLVRQGRAFGIHVLLGSQTLGGAYSLARSTMGQIAVRIALQCSESDAHLILSEDNMAARMLTRPGEAIYNDANGLVQGNHQFQIAWLDEAQREESISRMTVRRDEIHSEGGMVVFEGNVPPSMDLCAPLNAHLRATDDATRKPADGIRVWLGEPVAIAAPTSIELRRASGQNVLIVGQDEQQIDGLLAGIVLGSVGCRGVVEHPVQLTMLHDARDPDVGQRFASLKSALGSESMAIHESSECDAIIKQLHDVVIARETDAEQAGVSDHVLVIRDIGQFRSIRRDENDFGLGNFGEAKTTTSADMFGEIVKRGSLVGIHVVVWSDTYSNAIRWLSNALLREFENRVALRMNQTDSASLVDTPIAAGLGPGRAIIYRDQTGTVEKFRPFRWPSEEWLASIAPSGHLHGNDFDIDSINVE